MSRRGSCSDNAITGRLFAALEWELLADADVVTHAAVIRARVEFICTKPNSLRRGGLAWKAHEAT